MDVLKGNEFNFNENLNYTRLCGGKFAQNNFYCHFLSSHEKHDNEEAFLLLA